LSTKLLLLDTSALVFYFQGGKRFGKKTKSLLESATSLFLSPLSFFEIGLMQRGSKREASLPGLDGFAELGFETMAFSLEASEAALKLPAAIKDPFDLMLLGQASAASMGFVTSDRTIIEAGLGFVIDLSL
jgi:PIN domain nuclease of toxin-antitoxin system